MGNHPDTLAWFAVHTHPRAEKKASQRLQAQGLEVYLPLHRTLRQWSDRKKWVEAPFIPSYLFVHSSAAALFQVRLILGVTHVVAFEGVPAPIPAAQIDWLKKMLRQDCPLELSQEQLTPGDRVVVGAGPLIGLPGELVQHRGSQKVVVRLEQLGCSVLVTIDTHLLQRAV
ncbi:MAG: UpxY family transcription antiterminator [Bernardetiaceae bacterium]|jgi:transcription antitermination factor NusG|nr:UpxY family transcription antiterminator [Bernardetiaceae bacterium]